MAIDTIRKQMTHVREFQRAHGDSDLRYWFSLAYDPDYPDPSATHIRLITMHESMPLTRVMASQIIGGNPQALLYGRYLVVDVLDDIMPAIAESEPLEDGPIGAVEVVLAVYPGPGMATTYAVSSISLGLPGGAMNETLIFGASRRPPGWPP